MQQIKDENLARTALVDLRDVSDVVEPDPGVPLGDIEVDRERAVIPLPDVGPVFTRLSERIALRTATVSVVGLGYVGLPLLVTAGERGFGVIGVDADTAKIAMLRSGESYVGDVLDSQVRDLPQARFVDNAITLLVADVVVIAVPTPLKDGGPDLSLVECAVADVAETLRPGQLVVLESTTYPGTIAEVVTPILERSGLRSGVDFALAYSPERIDPGSGVDIQTVPKIVSGEGPIALDLADQFYRAVGFRTVRAPSPREAEMAKLIENTFRQVNIALVNELATVAADLEVDIWAALDAAATKPFGYLPFWPGPGVGGHCIAIDPTYLSWRAQQRRGFGLGFVQHALEVNNGMPAYVASRVGEALNAAAKPVRGSRVLALGMSYKPGVDDVRESPARLVVERLFASGALVSFHDPHVSRLTLGEQDLESVLLTDELLAAQDCVVILTAHPSVDYEHVLEHSSLVFDAQGITRHLHAPNAVRL
ncbi:MAG: nucleotide sugar dehydrogenase [Acidimicrobiia bacterium]